jgi:hypothetical protein
MKQPTDTTVITLTRRWFLAGLSALVLTVARPNRWQLGESPDAGSPLFQHFFRRDLHAAVHVGRTYLKSAPSERSEERLWEMVLDTPLGDAPDNIQDITARVRVRRARDFREGDLVAIDGWLLARTEARLCALAALGSAS